jgi:hypothetical protein
VTPLDILLTPSTPTAAAALDVLVAWSEPWLVNHCLRSWVWAATLGDSAGLDYDPELLFVAAMLHDIGVVEPFDSHSIAFEIAGGAVAWTFAAGAGWDAARRQRVREVIERHMWPSVDPALDVEGYLLEVSTTLDVRGAGAARWDDAIDAWPDLLDDVVARLPRLAFSDSFGAAIAHQASLKPSTGAARVHSDRATTLGAAFWDTRL